MNLTTFAFIISGVLLNACAQILLKAGANRVGPLDFDATSLPALQALALSGPVIAGLACYAVSVVVWIVALTRVEVSIAYPMLSIGYLVNAFAAWLLFGETLTLMRLAGIAVIIAGVYILTWGGRGA
jgi:multidrug transporter EmrE-like cation transporter